MVDGKVEEESKKVKKRAPRKKASTEGVKTAKTSRKNVEKSPSVEPPKMKEAVLVAPPVPKVVEPEIEVKKEPIIRFRKAKKKEKPTKKKDPKIREFFSEEHPGLYKLAKTFLPRMHIFVLLYFVLLAMYREYAKGNVDFIIDWYKVTPFATMPMMFHDFKGWFAEYGIIYLLWGMIIFCVLVTFYYVIWRYFFKDYYKNSEGSKRREGRVYWRNNNIWYAIWDRYYHSPPRDLNVYWLHLGFWFNIINPPASLIRLDTTLEEKHEVATYKLVVDEHIIRRKVNNDMKHLTTLDGHYDTDEIPTIYAQSHFDLISETLINDTTNLSFGNADTRNKVMQDGLRLSKSNIRRKIIASRDKVAKDTDRSN